jgi:deoxycytidine triphosphate deaminase
MKDKKLELIGEQVSILVDHNIKTLATGSPNWLIGENYDEKQVKFASYELRVSNKIAKITSDNSGIITVGKDFIDNGFIDIHPNQTLRLYTFEKLKLPTNVLARITVVGQIFSSGLFAENTFADPGFGVDDPLDLYITVINTTSRIIRIPVHSKLARIEFYRIGEGVEKSFSGTPSDIHLKYINAYKDCIAIPTDIDQSKLLEKFSDNLINYKDEDRCIQHFSIIQKSIIEEKKLNGRLRSKVNQLYIMIFFIISILFVILLYLFLPENLAPLSFIPLVINIIYPIFSKNARNALNDIVNKEK